MLKGRVGIEIALKSNVILEDGTSSVQYIFQEVGEIKSGNSFGELALLNDKPRSATSVCKEECHFAILGKKHYNSILGN